MKMSKDLLEHLKITSLLININDKDYLVYFQKYEKNRWTLFLPNEINLEENDLVLQINFHNETQFVFSAEIIEKGSDYCIIQVPDNIDDYEFQKMIKTLYELEYKDDKFGRRKEIRLKIGKENYKDFGLSGLQQSVFLRGNTQAQPCVVVDASIHGICLITPYISGEHYENFYVKLNFSSPDQNILLQLHKVNIKINTVGNENYATISCQLLEPINFAWKDRIYNMIEKNT